MVLDTRCSHFARDSLHLDFRSNKLVDNKMPIAILCFSQSANHSVYQYKLIRASHPNCHFKVFQLVKMNREFPHDGADECTQERKRRRMMINAQQRGYNRVQTENAFNNANYQSLQMPINGHVNHQSTFMQFSRPFAARHLSDGAPFQFLPNMACTSQNMSHMSQINNNSNNANTVVQGISGKRMVKIKFDKLNKTEKADLIRMKKEQKLRDGIEFYGFSISDYQYLHQLLDLMDSKPTNQSNNISQSKGHNNNNHNSGRSSYSNNNDNNNGHSNENKNTSNNGNCNSIGNSNNNENNNIKYEGNNHNHIRIHDSNNRNNNNRHNNHNDDNSNSSNSNVNNHNNNKNNLNANSGSNRNRHRIGIEQDDSESKQRDKRLDSEQKQKKSKNGNWLSKITNRFENMQHDKDPADVDYDGLPLSLKSLVPPKKFKEKRIKSSILGIYKQYGSDYINNHLNTQELQRQHNMRLSLHKEMHNLSKDIKLFKENQLKKKKKLGLDPENSFKKQLEEMKKKNKKNRNLKRKEGTMALNVMEYYNENKQLMKRCDDIKSLIIEEATEKTKVLKLKDQGQSVRDITSDDLQPVSNALINGELKFAKVIKYHLENIDEIETLAGALDDLKRGVLKGCIGAKLVNKTFAELDERAKKAEERRRKRNDKNKNKSDNK